ncbi:hypothetical protein [Sphingobacterium faecium]|nr:hypothetical protein [Sphingobacterium faecium]MDH5827037.1 hypothetical protein [Sphingobacterium faecium]
MERSIVHGDLDTFFVSVERFLDVSLTGRALMKGTCAPEPIVEKGGHRAP